MKLLALMCLVCGILIAVAVSAKEVRNTSSDCADVMMLFARGSSSNNAHEFLDDPFNPSTFGSKEEVGGAFFRALRDRIEAKFPHVSYKALSIHDSGRGWSTRGYPAVGIFSTTTVNNMFDAKWAWWPAGEYQESISSGATEVIGQLAYEVNRCPEQRYVIGGYSQGAHVIHLALNQMPAGFRNVIDRAVLFGDPKFDASRNNEAYLPWVRGSASAIEQGIAGVMEPYVPNDMIYKTISWCHEDDFVCSGLSGLAWSVAMQGNAHEAQNIWNSPVVAFGRGHTRYVNYGAPDAAEEVFNAMSAHLSRLNIARGGLDPGLDPGQKTYSVVNKDSNASELMFLVNKTGGNEDGFQQFSSSLQRILTDYTEFYPNTKTGSMLFTDMAGSSGFGNSYVAALTQAPNQLSANPSDAFKYSPYLYGGLGGGGDYPENHGMALERAAMFSSWGQNTKKRIVLIAERPAVFSYAFNACNSMVLAQLPLQIAAPCAPGTNYVNTTQSVLCASLFTVMEARECPYTGSNPNSAIVKRKLDDILLLLRQKNVIVDVIQPHTARTNQQDYPAQYVGEQLKSIADATGGLYLKYETFNEQAMRDAVWRILGDQPRQGAVSAFALGETVLGGAGQAQVSGDNTLNPSLVGTSYRVTAHPSALSYDWSVRSPDNTLEATRWVTEGPVVRSDRDLGGNLLYVKAYSGPLQSGEVLSTSIAVIKSNGPVTQPKYTASVLENDTVFLAERSGDTINVGWDGSSESLENAIVSAHDPTTGIIVASIPFSGGSLQVDGYSGDTLLIKLYNGSYEAPATEVSIQDVSISDDEPAIVPLEVANDPQISNTQSIQSAQSAQQTQQAQFTQPTQSTQGSAANSAFLAGAARVAEVPIASSISKVMGVVDVISPIGTAAKEQSKSLAVEASSASKAASLGVEGNAESQVGAFLLGTTVRLLLWFNLLLALFAVLLYLLRKRRGGKEE